MPYSINLFYHYFYKKATPVMDNNSYFIITVIAYQSK